MAHNNHTTSNFNQDLNLAYPNRDAWLELAGDWKDPFGDPQLVEHDGFTVVREDLMGFGSKCRFGDILLQKHHLIRSYTYSRDMVLQAFL